MKLITVPNDSEGQQFVKSLRKFVKNTPRMVKVRGRGPRKPHALSNSYWDLRRVRQDLPLDKSTHLAIYLESRPTVRRKFITETVTRSVWVPTKWGTKS